MYTQLLTKNPLTNSSFKCHLFNICILGLMTITFIRSNERL